MTAILVAWCATSAMASVASAQRWQDATAQCLGTTSEWTNKVEVADLEGDGFIDILVANGGGYATQGSAEMSRVWKNNGNWTGGGTHCTEVTSTVLMSFNGRSRMIKAADVDNDGDLDILTGGAFQSQLKLFTQAPGGVWTDSSAQLPQQNTSAGDAEFGDVDADGDLDIVIADWGSGNPSVNTGGRTKLYRNNGSGTFTDETTTSMPMSLVRWSWDIELVDVDNDWDLDILVSCKACTGSFLFRNNGLGTFSDDVGALPQFANNYDFEPMDIDNDDDLDLVTVNDGPNVTEHIFVNNGNGMFANETAMRLAGTANPAGVDDNAAVWMDVDSDGDADLLFATLGDERLLLNDGTGVFTLDPMGATPNDTPATLGMAVADIDGDTRLDIVQGQGEVMSQFAEKLQLASTTGIALDTFAPRVRWESKDAVVTARVHDRIGPSHPHDFKSVVVRVGGTDIPMKWYGEMLWRAQVSLEQIGLEKQVCATDRANNETCTSVPGGGDAGTGIDAGTGPGDKDDGGCCDTRRDARGSLLLALFVALVLSARTRPTRRRSCSAPQRRR